MLVVKMSPNLNLCTKNHIKNCWLFGFQIKLNILHSRCPKLEGFAPNVVQVDSRIESVQNTKRQ